MLRETLKVIDELKDESLSDKSTIKYQGNFLILTY